MAKKKKDFLEGKVLVPKPGKEQEFKDQLTKIHDIAHGALGWQGQAEMFYSIDSTGKAFGVKLKGSKKNRLNQLKKMIQQSFLQSLYQYAEWVPEEQAKNRHAYNKVLYGEKG